MSYPVSLKEFYSTHNGVNTLLVKKNNRREAPPPIFNPCNGATDTVQLILQYRGSDWGTGISYAVEVDGVVYNEDFRNRWFHRYDSNWEEPFEFNVGSYRFETTMGIGNTGATLRVLPHDNDDYIKVKLIPDPDVNNNRLLGVSGGGVVDYDMFTNAAEFCLKPTKKPPISCIGASDRIMFGSQPMEQSMEQTFAATAVVESPSGLTEMIYNVTMDGTNYGVIDFVQTPNPMFGNVGLSFSEIPDGDGDCILKIQGGNIGDNHRFKLEPVESRGGNNIVDIYLDDGGLDAPSPEFPTVEHNQETGVVEFCFAVMGKCDLAPDYLSFSHYDREVDEEPGRGAVFPLVYNVTLNGVDFGEINFKNSEGGPYLTELGDYTISYVPGRWGRGTLGLAGGPVGVPAHIILDPVDAVRSNINHPDMNRTVEYDYATKRVEFCLTRHECSGATNNIKLFASPGGSSEENYTQFFHSIEFDGYVINADNSVDLLSRGYMSTEDRAIEVSVYSNETDGTITIALQSNSKHGVRKVTIKPPNDGENFVTGVHTLSNPTVVEHAGGVITGCIDIWQPQ